MSGLDLYLSQRVFLAMLAVSAAAGVGLGLVYDLLVFLRLLLRIPTPRRVAEPPETGEAAADGSQEALEDCPKEADGKATKSCPPSPGFWGDLLFSLLTAVTLILLAYYTNDGVLRAPAVVGLSVGFGVWYRTVGRLLRRAAIHLSRFFRRLAWRLLCILWWPFRRISGLVWRGMRWTWRKTAGKCLFSLRSRAAERRLRLVAEAETNAEGTNSADREDLTA